MSRRRRSAGAWGCGLVCGLACGLLQAVFAPAWAADAARGQQLMAVYHCGRCHSIPGVAASQGRLASALQAYGRRSYIVGRLPNTAPNLSRWLVDPAALVPGTLMPNMGVTATDADDMAAYLMSLD